MLLQFPFENADKVDRPQPIPKNFFRRKTIGGNGHENLTLIRLLSTIIGMMVPEEDKALEILLDLKDLVELVLSPVFTEDVIQYLSMKISDHRQLLQEVFPDVKLRPKHHYIEHYPQMIRRFGPLVHFWTIRFEGKHKVFKKIVHDAQNFKNVPKTLAYKHQQLMAYHLSLPNFFKPSVETFAVKNVFVNTLRPEAQSVIHQITKSTTVYRTSKIAIDSIYYATGMFVCTEVKWELPQFKKIVDIIVNDQVLFDCQNYQSWFREHFRAYEVTAQESHEMKTQSELHDVNPLTAYRKSGQLHHHITTKHFLILS
ncbi:hypothetical protein L3Q82_001177 [Scortum barcoo]|uniref:Uncharacterized protein n=1 Tax=Scortum barcoo TaxID=214431 RepID=A0ACB8W826_9TELE|nr:hypothetical protein L3Q82_001177 [Scortum barcoo]